MDPREEEIEENPERVNLFGVGDIDEASTASTASSASTVIEIRPKNDELPPTLPPMGPRRTLYQQAVGDVETGRPPMGPPNNSSPFRKSSIQSSNKTPKTADVQLPGTEFSQISHLSPDFSQWSSPSSTIHSDSPWRPVRITEDQKQRIDNTIQMLESKIEKQQEIKKKNKNNKIMKEIINTSCKSMRHNIDTLRNPSVPYNNKETIMNDLENEENTETSSNEENSETSSNEENSQEESVKEEIEDFDQLLHQVLNDVRKDSEQKEKLDDVLKPIEGKLNDLLNNEIITASDLESIFNSKKDKANKSDDISLLSTTTDAIMENPILSKLRGNFTTEDSSKRLRNVNIIVDSIFVMGDNLKQKQHTQTGKDISVRNRGERNDTTEKQFLNVWGGLKQPGTQNDQVKWATESCCYLCGGPNVNEGSSPEMEHKIPSIEFFTKVHNINEKYPYLSNSWRTYVDENIDEIHDLYNYINCNPDNWAITDYHYQPTNLDNIITQKYKFINNQINKTLKDFKPEKKEENEERLEDFIRLLKVYLMEFAYSHHTCNQVKENANLNNVKERTEYIKSLSRALSLEVDVKNIKGMLNSTKRQKEISSIHLDRNVTDMSNNKNYKIIGAHIELINAYIRKYAFELYKDDEQIKRKSDKSKEEYCLKKMMVQSIKSTINYLVYIKNKEQDKKQLVLANKNSERFIDILQALTNLKKIIDEYKGISRPRAKKIFTTRKHSDAYSKSNSYNLFLDVIDGLKEDNTVKQIIIPLVGEEPEKMYNELKNSDLFKKLETRYKNDELANLKNYMDMLDESTLSVSSKRKTPSVEGPSSSKRRGGTRRLKLKSIRKTRKR